MADVVKANCNECGPQRNHEVLHSVESKWDFEDVGIDGTDRYSLIRCNGCDNIHLKHDSWCSEYVQQDDDGWKTVYYPPAISRRAPDWLNDFSFNFNNREVCEMLQEIYSATHNDARRLAAMGIRALLEYIMIEQVGENGSIGTNVKKFLAEGFVAERYHELFSTTLIESGHAAMHRNYQPEKQDILTLLDITEGLIAQIYIHPTKASKIKIPARKFSGNIKPPPPEA